ncbi:MAG: transposase [Kibdelosporangium sp.]
MTAVVAVPQVGESADLTAYCRLHLSSLARSDQKKWGEVYVRGLVSVPGRKSIRRIADQVVGRRADQALQQFVNQSTWRWEPVRRSLALQAAEIVQPKAWVAMEAVFPKHGASSVGVAKQYAPSAGRVVNCQLGLALFMAGTDASCPVNWRLLLPGCWDTDNPRRARTHLPDTERPRPRWHYLVDAVDQMTLGWNLPAAPLLFDATHEPDLEPRLRSLEERGLQYVVQVAPNASASWWAGLRQAGGPIPTAGEFAALAARSNTQPLVSQTYTTGGTRIVAASVPRPEGQSWFTARANFAPQQLVAIWPAGQPKPKSLWLTNISRARLPELTELISLHSRTADDLRHLEDSVGLQHFEGRSFPGWHHHVTLASMAHAYNLTQAVPLRQSEKRYLLSG